MEIVNLNQVPSFVTKDGSEIRELLAHRNSAIRNQSLAEARVPVGGATQEHYPGSPNVIGVSHVDRALLRAGRPVVRDACRSTTLNHPGSGLTVRLRVVGGGLYSCPWKNPFARRNGPMFNQRNPARIGGAVADGPQSSLFVTARTRAPVYRR